MGIRRPKIRQGGSKNVMARLCVAVWFAAAAFPAAAAGGLGQPVYREVQWPAPARTSVGSPSPWHWGEVVAVATTAQGAILVLHRGAQTHHGIRRGGRVSAGMGRRDDQRGQGDAGGPTVSCAGGFRVCGRIRAPRVVRPAAPTRYGPTRTAASGWSMRPDMWFPGWIRRDESSWNSANGASRGPAAHTSTCRPMWRSRPVARSTSATAMGTARIVKFSSEGEYMLEWGTRGKGPGEFGLPHNLVVDAGGRVYVTDRDNQRIQVFDADGTFRTEWTETGAVSSLFLTAGSEDLDRCGAARPRRYDGCQASLGHGWPWNHRHAVKSRSRGPAQRSGTEVRT